MIIAWTGSHRVLAVEAVLMTGEFVIATQTAFRVHFVPDMILWVLKTLKKSFTIAFCE